jgi:hypothetical protein
VPFSFLAAYSRFNQLVLLGLMQFLDLLLVLVLFALKKYKNEQYTRE